MTSLNLFTEALERASNPINPPSGGPRSAEQSPTIPIDPSLGRSLNDFSHCTPPNSAVEGHCSPYEAPIDYASSQHHYDYAPPPRNSELCNNFRVHGQASQECRQHEIDLYDTQAHPDLTASSTSQQYPSNLYRQPIQFAGEPPQSKPSVLEDLFSDIDESETIGEPFDEFGGEVLSEVPGALHNQQQPETQCQSTELFGYSTEFITDARAQYVEVEGENWEDEYACDHFRSPACHPSPTESQLVAGGFEFHNELPEDVQITHFNDKAFRKALRELKPDLPRKQQWYAWDKVRHMMRLAASEAIVDKWSEGSPRQLVANPAQNGAGLPCGHTPTDDTHWACRPPTPEYVPQETPTGNEPLESQWGNPPSAPATDSTCEEEPQNDGQDVRGPWSVRQPHVDNPSSPMSAGNGPVYGCACACAACQWPCPADDCRCDRDETPMPQSTRSQSVDRLSKHAHGWLIAKVVQSNRARSQTSVVADSAIKEDLEREAVPVVRIIEDNNPPPISHHTAPPPVACPVPIERASSPLRSEQNIAGIDRPDTPRPMIPYDECIRQSVEPETLLHTRHRESTPAFENRSPSPSPVSHTGMDIDINMPDAEDYSPPPPVLSIPRTHLPHTMNSSPDPLSSPIQHTVTAPETALLRSSPLRQSISQTQRRSQSPSKPPLPPAPTPAPMMAKQTKRGDKNRRKSAVAPGSGVEKTSSSAASKSRNVTRKVTESVKKVVKQAVAGGKKTEMGKSVKEGKVAEAVKRIERGLSGEGSPPRRSMRIAAKK